LKTTIRRASIRAASRDTGRAWRTGRAYSTSISGFAGIRVLVETGPAPYLNSELMRGFGLTFDGVNRTIEAPLNIQFMGRARDDAKLVGLAYAFEHYATLAGCGHRVQPPLTHDKRQK
jgi:hypothetical protein